MKKIVIIPFASRLHGESYYLSILELFKSQLSKLGYGDLVYAPVITDKNEIEKIVDQYREFLPVILPITGGTSGLMYEYAIRANYESILMFGHGEHNSLAAALSARYRIEREGIGVYIFQCRELGSQDCLLELDLLGRVLSALSTILSSRILLITPSGEKTPEIELYEEIFDSIIDVVSMDTLFSELEHVENEYIDRFTEKISGLEFTLRPDKIVEIAKIYGLIKTKSRERGYIAIGIDCFPYLIKYKVTPCLALSVLNSEDIITACEGDLSAIALMLISKALTGLSGWISNATAFQGRHAYFSHCTIALNMVKKSRILTHFESGYPYGLAGELPRGLYTFVSLSDDYSVMSAGTGILVQSGLLNDKMCRTQAVIELNYDAEVIPRYASANHHVLIPGDVRRELRAIAWLLGVDYYDYNELK